MINITISNLQKRLPIHRVRIKNLVLKVIKGEGFKKPGDINICFTDNILIKKLNAEFLKADRVTDVLAFKLSDEKIGGRLIADIVISTDAAARNARLFRTSSGEELLLYVTHGMLHILGYDDRSKAQTQLMRKKEREYVNR
ncbi:MAG: rRNA maturation RNase YbeY [Candidatus Omnitrophica bacterium]|nr:rRNA maturation RNase YbeY [Candidatus Omnitrophota bacterium]